MTARVTALIAALRRVFGMPDYAAYCAHVRQAHPGAPMPSEREYFEAYLKARYEGGPNRCC
jgi:uncharacterized short protein YbdD (DUF466 family)